MKDIFVYIELPRVYFLKAYLVGGPGDLEVLGVEGTRVLGLVNLVGANLEAVEEVAIGSNIARKNNVILESKDVVNGLLTSEDILNKLSLVAGVTLEEINLQQLISLRSAVTVKLKTEVLANINSLSLSRVLDIETETTLLVFRVVKGSVARVILSGSSVGVGVAGRGDLESGGGGCACRTLLSLDHVGNPDTVVVKTSSGVGGDGVGDGSLGVQ